MGAFMEGNPRRAKLYAASPGQWKRLKSAARAMRKCPTAAEEALWEALRGGRLGARFRRQHAIGRFVVDFVCVTANLIVEVDGTIHDNQRQEDAYRDREMESRGYRVTRFTNEEVLHDLTAVLGKVKSAMKYPRDIPSPNGRGVGPKGRG
jgi:very-short-patch-repair endonuclease